MNEVLSIRAEQDLREQQEIELYEAFGLLGDNPDEASVEYAFPDQSEVVLRDDDEIKRAG